MDILDVVLAHRQELALKNALKGTMFDVVDDMLTRLSYVRV